DPTSDTSLTIAKADSKVAFADFDTIAYRQQVTRLRAIMAKLAPKMAPGAAAAAPPALTDDDRKVLVDVVAALPKTMSAYSWGFSVEGAAAPARDGSIPIQLAHGALDFALKGINSDKAEMDLSLRHDGLALSASKISDPIIQALYP